MTVRQCLPRVLYIVYSLGCRTAILSRRTNTAWLLQVSGELLGQAAQGPESVSDKENVGEKKRKQCRCLFSSVLGRPAMWGRRVECYNLSCSPWNLERKTGDLSGGTCQLIQWRPLPLALLCQKSEGDVSNDGILYKWVILIIEKVFQRYWGRDRLSPVLAGEGFNWIFHSESGEADTKLVIFHSSFYQFQIFLVGHFWWGREFLLLHFFKIFPKGDIFVLSSNL